MSKLCSGLRVRLQWTSGHSGVKGNEWPDQEAKRAAVGNETRNKVKVLTKALPVSAAAVKAARKRHDTAARAQWWRNSPYRRV